MNDAPGRAALLSFYPARSGDVVFQPRPYFFIRAAGSTHGSPYDYDTHVPLLWFGPAWIKPGRYLAPVDPVDIAPTLATSISTPASTPSSRPAAAVR